MPIKDPILRNKYYSDWRKANPEKASKWAREHPEKQRAKIARWKKNNPEKVAAWTKANADKVYTSFVKWRKANPEKRRAHRLASEARIPMIECVRCGSKKRLHRHHPDYAKPLEVIILCAKCHGEEHIEMRRIEPVLKDAYSECFPEDLEWISEMMKRRKI